MPYFWVATRHASQIDTGGLVNRFSQDIRLIDMVLPRGFINTGFQLCGSLAQAAVAVVAMPYLAAAILVVAPRPCRSIAFLWQDIQAAAFSGDCNEGTGGGPYAGAVARTGDPAGVWFVQGVL